MKLKLQKKKVGGVMLRLLRAEYLHKISGILLNRILPITLYLFIIYLLIVIYGYLFYTFGYNPVLLICEQCLDCSNSDHWEFFQLAPMPHWHVPLIRVYELNSSLHSDDRRWSMLYLLICIYINQTCFLTAVANLNPLPHLSL